MEMEPSAEPQPNLPTNPIHKSKLLFSSLGIAFLTILLYLLLSELAVRLPETYGDQFLNWAGPLAGLSPENVWIVQGVILRIVACGLGLLILAGLVKIVSGRRFYLPFARITKQHRASLSKNIVIYFVILIAQEISFSLLNLGRFVEGPEIQTAQIGLWGSFLTFFFIVIAGPVFEEVLFRGFLYARLRSAFKFWPAFVVSGLFFSLLHFDPQGSAAFNIYNIFNSFVFSYFVTKTFEETGNLWTSIIFHSVYNGWLMILLFIFSTIESLVAFPQ